MLQTVYPSSLYDPIPSSLHPLIPLTRFPGTVRAKGMASAPLDRSGAFAETLALSHNPFSSILTPAHRAPGPSGETPQLKEALHVLRVTNSAAAALQAAQVAPETVGVRSGSARGTSHGEPGMMQWGGYDAGVTLGSGDALSSVSREKYSAEVNPFRSSLQARDVPDEMINKNYNPFLD